MSENQLPQGWTLAAIQNLVATDGLISDGDWVESKDQDPDGSIRLIQLADIGDGDFRDKSRRFMSEDKADLLNCTFLKEGDVLVARMPDPLGRACLFPSIGQPAVTVVDVCLIRTGLNSAITNHLLKYWINSPRFRELVSENASGTTRKRITRKKLEKFEVPLPPLAEQKVIADKLDTLLAQVENTKARLERIPQILKRFRQSVLAAAVSGRLTGEWRDVRSFEAKKPTKGKEKHKADLFDSVRNSLPAIPRSWLVVPAAEVLEYVTSGSRGWSKYYSDSGALFLRMSNVRYDTTELDLNDLQYVRLPENAEGKRSLVEVDDLVVSITADVGRVARINNDVAEAYVNQHLALLRPTEDINSEYFATCIAAVNVGLKQVSTFKRGATKAGLGLDDIRSLALPYPSLEEQAEIVRRVHQLFAHADRIEKQITNALARVNNLTQSILAKAFRGELTAQWRKDNPELIRGENSAEALLDRIRNEREISNKQTKKRKIGIKKNTGKPMTEKLTVVEALKQAGKPLSGQQLLQAAGYPSDSNTEDLERFFLDLRDATLVEKTVATLDRDDDSQDWFALTENDDQPARKG